MPIFFVNEDKVNKALEKAVEAMIATLRAEGFTHVKTEGEADEETCVEGAINRGLFDNGLLWDLVSEFADKEVHPWINTDTAKPIGKQTKVSVRKPNVQTIPKTGEDEHTPHVLPSNLLHNPELSDEQQIMNRLDTIKSLVVNHPTDCVCEEADDGVMHVILIFDTTDCSINQMQAAMINGYFGDRRVEITGQSKA